MSVTQQVYRVLLDTSIRPLTVTHQAVLKERRIQWGGRNITAQVEAIVPRELTGHSADNTALLFESLAFIAQEARHGRIALFDSSELLFEWMGLRLPTLRGTQYDLFSGVAITHVRAPVVRSVSWGFGWDKTQFQERKRTFLARIRDERFRAIDRATNGHHSADAFHLWTAEINNLDCYLTCDRRFLNRLRRQRHITTSVSALNPYELCARLRGEHQDGQS